MTLSALPRRQHRPLLERIASDYRDALTILAAVLEAVDETKLQESVRAILPAVRAQLPKARADLDAIAAAGAIR